MKHVFFSKSKSLYTKLLLSFTIIIILSIVILSSLLYVNYSKSALNTVYESNLKYLSQISYSANYMDNMAKNFCMSTFSSNSIIPLIYGNKEDMFSMGNAIRSLDSFVIPNTYVQSIYTYNRSLDLYISNTTNNFDKSKDFYDREIVEYIESINNTNKVLSPIPRRIRINGGSEALVNVYTYLMYNPLYNTGKVEGAVVLNIKGDWLKELIGALDKNSTSTKSSDIFVVDKDGIVVSHTEKDMFLKNISKEQHIKKALSAGKDSGIFVDTIDNKKVVVTYVASQVLGWRFISLTPYQDIISTLQNIKIITLAFCLIVLLLGLLFSLFLSKKLYMPINNLISNIHEKMSASIDFKRKGDEVNYLSSVFERVIEKVEEMEKQNRDNIQTHKNEFLKLILNGNMSFKLDEINRQFKELSISIDPNEKMFMYILKIDGYKHFSSSNSEKDRSLWKFAIANIAQEITAHYFVNEVIDMGSDHIVVLFNTASKQLKEYDDFEELVSRIITDIQEYAGSCLKLSLSAAVGYINDDIVKLSTLYYDTLNLSLYRIKLGHKCSVLPNMINKVNKEAFLFPTSKEKILIDSLKLGDLERANHAYLDIISGVLEYSYDNIMASIVYLLLSIHNSQNVIRQKTETKVSFILNTLFSQVSNLETIDEINELFFEIFKEIIDIGNKAKNKKTDTLINKIIGIIEDHYQDKALCLNSIADSINMSPAYIGKLFKDDTTKSIAEYINNYRMEKVIGFLNESQLALDEILEKCGIEKSSYFYTSFKKFTGVSLGEYRLRQKDMKKP